MKSNEYSINKIEINSNEEKEFISSINDLSSLIIEFFQTSKRNNENLNESIKSFKNNLLRLKSIPEDILNKINLYNLELEDKIDSNDSYLRQFFEKVKKKYKIMEEKKPIYSESININYISQVIQRIKKNNEEIRKEIGAKVLIINNLKLQILQLEEDMDLSNQKKKIEELNEIIKKISIENDQQRKLLEKNGLEIVGGEVLNISKADILERYQNENQKLKEKIKILGDFDKQYKKLIQYGSYRENINLKNNLKEDENEMDVLKKNLIKIKDVKLIREKDEPNSKHKELENNYTNNNFINSLNNININSQIYFDRKINRLNQLEKENEKLKKENQKLKDEINSLKSKKRNSFENPKMSKEE